MQFVSGTHRRHCLAQNRRPSTTRTSRPARFARLLLTALLLTVGAGLGQSEPPPIKVSDSNGDGSKRPVLQDVQWTVGDSTVDAVLHFDQTPSRYAAYALEDPPRIVVDCYNTRAGMLLDPQAPPPVLGARLTGEAMGDEVRFLRLVLFTERTIGFEAIDTESEVRVIMRYNTNAEQERIRRTRRKRLALFSVIAGTVVAGATVGIIIGTADSNGDGGDDASGSDVIPPPDMEPPLGLMIVN
ncbi:MAG: hypothetical protein GF331_03945 [Chitinivibrionales bacterium]|nr:hypothetical protein [Chitinivibrionales bacterium]